jgi:NAD(P)H dehydrogenase (quinone)
VRDPKRAPKLPGAEIVQASAFGNPRDMGRALGGIETVFMVSAHDKMTFAQRSTVRQQAVQNYDRVQQHTTAVDVAAAVGVQRVVDLSFMNADADATFVLARDHFYTEEHLKSTGLAYTILRMCLYADDIPDHVSPDLVIRGPFGWGRCAWVTRDDLADVIVAALTQSGHENKTYDVTGPEALTYEETAAILSKAVGKKIPCQMIRPSEARAKHAVSGLDGYESERIKLGGAPFNAYEVEIWVTHMLQIAVGDIGQVSDTVPKLTGHKAMSVAEFLQKYPQSYKHLVTGKAFATAWVS